MSKYGRAADWGGSPLEELGVWAMLQPGAHHKPNIKALACILNPEFLNLRKDMAYVEAVSE